MPLDLTLLYPIIREEPRPLVCGSCRWWSAHGDGLGSCRDPLAHRQPGVDSAVTSYLDGADCQQRQ